MHIIAAHSSINLVPINALGSVATRLDLAAVLCGFHFRLILLAKIQLRGDA
jgi:hypothetical protein